MHALSSPFQGHPCRPSVLHSRWQISFPGAPMQALCPPFLGGTHHWSGPIKADPSRHQALLDPKQILTLEWPSRKDKDNPERGGVEQPLQNLPGGKRQYTKEWSGLAASSRSFCVSKPQDPPPSRDGWSSNFWRAQAGLVAALDRPARPPRAPPGLLVGSGVPVRPGKQLPPVWPGLSTSRWGGLTPALGRVWS